MSLTFPAPLRRWWPLCTRIAAALFGGYLLGALTCTATLTLPIEPVQAVFTGMLLSFLIHAGACIWVFAVRSATRAWLGLAAVALPLWLLTRLLVEGAAA